MGADNEDAENSGESMNLQAFWEDILAQNREALPGYFYPNAIIRWHCTNEQFTVPEFIWANCDYPGEWDGEIEREERHGNEAITVVRVFPKDGYASFHVVSFMKLRDEKIITMDEYWADDGDAPGWRKSMGIGKPIR